MNKDYSLVIVAEHIYDGIHDEVYQGYLCVKDKKIVKVGRGVVSDTILNRADKVLKFQREFIMPGITDTHTFFTGYAIFHLGVDVSSVKNSEEGKKIIKEYDEKKQPKVIFGHGWNPENWEQKLGEEMLEESFPDKPVILFSLDRNNCIMNQKAKEIYGFTSDSCYPESYYRIMKEYLNDREFIEQELKRYMNMLNSYGVTTVKEMGFDDFYGFTDYLKEIENSNHLHIRFFFMSQPVGEPMNLEYAKKMRKQFVGNKIRFSGFNRMTDGTIASYKGDLKKPYENKDFNCSMKIPYEEIERDVLEADREGFRWSLHAQGDGAVEKITKIYEKCQKENGRLKNGHAITDMEFTDPKDLEKLGELGVNAELYFQIMSLDPGDVLKENIEKTIGRERGKYYWNRRKIVDSGLNVSGATDLPLLIPNVPESIYYSCGGYLDGEDEAFQVENTLTVLEILKAWTIGGQRNLGMEEVLGTIEEGKFADIAIFDRDLTTENLKNIKDAKVIMTIMDGEVVYKRG